MVSSSDQGGHGMGLDEKKKEGVGNGSPGSSPPSGRSARKKYRGSDDSDVYKEDSDVHYSAEDSGGESDSGIVDSEEEERTVRQRRRGPRKTPTRKYRKREKPSLRPISSSPANLPPVPGHVPLYPQPPQLIAGPFIPYFKTPSMLASHSSTNPSLSIPVITTPSGLMVSTLTGQIIHPSQIPLIQPQPQTQLPSILPQPPSHLSSMMLGQMPLPPPQYPFLAQGPRPTHMVGSIHTNIAPMPLPIYKMPTSNRISITEPPFKPQIRRIVKIRPEKEPSGLNDEFSIARARSRRTKDKVDYSTFDNTVEEEISDATTELNEMNEGGGEEEDYEEAEDRLVEKILASQIMSFGKAMEENDKTCFIVPGQALSVDSLRLLLENEKLFESDRIEMLFLVKAYNRSYWHTEWVTRELILNERGGHARLNRFLSKSGHGFENVDPAFTKVDRIVHDYEEDNRRSFFVKWQNMGFDECTWEFEDEFRRRDLNAEEHILSFLTRKRPSSEKLGARDSVISSRLPRLYKAVSVSPEYRTPNLSLRGYQLEGLNWLTYCWTKHQSCIIADEMGLGKTVQTVAFLDRLTTEYKLPGPFLVVAPLSTIPHWQREFAAWTTLGVLVYHGSSRSREAMFDYEFFYRDEDGHVLPNIFKFEVILTTYEMVLVGMGHLQEIPYRVGVFDEAHRLKNRDSKASEVLRNFRIEHKVLLSGTPLQNSLEELWALLNFMQPFRFYDEAAFLQEYGIDRSEDVVKLQGLLRPLMLRRLKEDVETIPVKEETIIEVEMTPVQKRYYRAILERNLAYLMQGTKGSNVPNLANVVVELRKVCMHPFLIQGAEETLRRESGFGSDSKGSLALLLNCSGKFVLVDKLLHKLREQGRRVLIFSQMTKCLDLLEDLLATRGWPWERIDGSVRGQDRQIAIDRFCDLSKDSFVFLLGTRAGGVGINLTAADTVVIFDSDWNPQNDLQAQARCHRIGQTRSVQVYRLVCRDTYEQEILDRASRKLGLGSAILQPMGGEGSSLASMYSKKELEMLLKKGAYEALGNDESFEFGEEDIDQILQRRTTVIKHGAVEKTSIFSKASFATCSDFEIDVDDPNFWTLWAKRAGASNAIKEDGGRRLGRQLGRVQRLGGLAKTVDVNSVFSAVFRYGLGRSAFIAKRYSELGDCWKIHVATRKMFRRCVDSARLENRQLADDMEKLFLIIDDEADKIEKSRVEKYEDEEEEKEGDVTRLLIHCFLMQCVQTILNEQLGKGVKKGDWKGSLTEWLDVDLDTALGEFEPRVTVDAKNGVVQEGWIEGSDDGALLVAVWIEGWPPSMEKLSTVFPDRFGDGKGGEGGSEGFLASRAQMLVCMLMRRLDAAARLQALAYSESGLGPRTGREKNKKSRSKVVEDDEEKGVVKFHLYAGASEESRPVRREKNSAKNRRSSRRVSR